MQIKQENGGHAVIDQLTGEEVLTCAINIGEQLLMSGAEISRVEDTIRRICSLRYQTKPYIFHCILYHCNVRKQKTINGSPRPDGY